MTDQPIQTTNIGAHGDTCSSCGAGLNLDQRYCLACGTRRAGAALPFQQALARDGAAAAPAAAGSGGASDGTRSSLPALASIGCLLLALGVGVVIGTSGGSDSSTAATPQVISVGGTGTTTGADGATSTTDKNASGKSDASSSSTSSGASKATNSTLKKLDNLSPTEYQKQSMKLPKTVETGGTPPPKDNKAPANGGSFESIG